MYVHMYVRFNYEIVGAFSKDNIQNRVQIIAESFFVDVFSVIKNGSEKDHPTILGRNIKLAFSTCLTALPPKEYMKYY